MNGHCSTCPVEKDCAYEYKPCDCRDQLKFKPMPQPAQRTWVGLTNQEKYDCLEASDCRDALCADIEARLRSKNT